MGKHNLALVVDTLEEATSRSERMPFCAEREAMDLERNGATARVANVLIRSGIHESIAILDLEERWYKRLRGNSSL